MKPRVTMRDVAQAAGVSPMTVSRAFKDDATVNAKTRQMVREAARRLGYVYDTTAQAFRAQRSGFVAVTLPSINNANFAATHRALNSALTGTDLQLLLGITDYAVDEEERLVQQLLARRPEAIVLTGGAHTDQTRGLILALDVPVIEIWDLPDDPLGHVIGFSNADAMAMVVSHLVETGRQKLAFLGAADDSDRRGRERRRGALQAARDLGLPDIDVIDAGPAPVTMTNGAAAIQALGRDLLAYDAIVCVSDPVAFGALSVCGSLGIKVPEDLAITGFGAFEIASVAVPQITTVDVGAQRIGLECGRLIADLLSAGDRVTGMQRVDTGCRIVPGGTT